MLQKRLQTRTTILKNAAIGIRAAVVAFVMYIEAGTQPCSFRQYFSLPFFKSWVTFSQTVGPFEICFCRLPLLQFFSFAATAAAATCFPFLLNPTAFPAGPGLHGVGFPSLKACMLRSSCAGDLPATLFISSINRFCILLRIVYLFVCSRSLFFF